MTSPIQFIKEVRNELAKVVWPTRKETIRITIGVIGICIFGAIILGATDYGLTKLIEFIISKQ